MTIRKIFIAVFIADLLLAGFSPALLPSRVAIHFGCGGMPDNWASSFWSALIFIVFIAFLFSALYFSPRLML
ncbi:MAG: DUF1648 domain-containing protein, partial [Candidatus Aureabacteria bacterium]|nr:DUF1648 domain-containing protein [Candidatus Auribacterota bacterium]